MKRTDNTWMEESLCLQMPDARSLHRHRRYTVFWMKDFPLIIVDLYTCSHTSACLNMENRKTEGAHLFHFFCSDSKTYKLLFYIDSQQQLEIHTGALLESESFLDANEVESFKCLKRPKHASCSASFLPFVTEENCVRVVGWEYPDNVLEIQHFELGLSQIDKISFFCTNKIIIFNYKTRIVVTVQLSHQRNNLSVDWSVVEAYKLNVPHEDEITLCGNIGRSNFWACIGNNIFLGKP